MKTVNKKRLKSSFEEGQDALDWHLSLPNKRVNLRVLMPLTAAELTLLEEAATYFVYLARESDDSDDVAPRKYTRAWEGLLLRIKAQDQKLRLIKKLERQKLRLAKATKGRARK